MVAMELHIQVAEGCIISMTVAAEVYSSWTVLLVLDGQKVLPLIIQTTSSSARKMTCSHPNMFICWQKNNIWSSRQGYLLPNKWHMFISKPEKWPIVIQTRLFAAEKKRPIVIPNSLSAAVRASDWFSIAKMWVQCECRENFVSANKSFY